MTDESRPTVNGGLTPADQEALKGAPAIPETIGGLIMGFEPGLLEGVAIQWMQGEDWRELTYGALFEQVRDLAVALRAKGIGSGDRVGLLSENRPEWLLGYLAITSIGAATVSMDVFWSAAELGQVLETAEPKLVFTSKRFIQKIDAARERVTSLEHVALFDALPELVPDPDAGADSLFAGQPHIDFQALCRAGAARRAAGAEGLETAEVSADDTATIIFLSTGVGVELTHRGIMANHEGFMPLMGGRACCQKRWLSLIPFHHAWPTVQGFLFPMLTGSRLVLAPSPKLDVVMRVIKEQGIDYLQLVPALVERLYEFIGQQAKAAGLFDGLGLPKGTPLPERFEAALRHPERQETLTGILDALGLPAMECIFSAGAHIYLGSATELKAIGIDILNAYGLTETSPAICHSTRRWHKMGSAGRVFHNIDVKIDAPDKWGNGEILCRGPILMGGYFRDPDKTAAVMDDEGFLHTGDVGVLDDEGYLYITGRCKNVVVTPGGKNVYPAELEDTIGQSPLVADIVVVSRIKGRNEFPYALIRLDVKALAEREAAEGKRYDESALRALMQDEIQRTTTDVAHYKLPPDFELTFDALDAETLRGRELRFEEAQPEGSFLALGIDTPKATPADEHHDHPSADQALLTRAIAGFLCREIERVVKIAAAEVDLELSFFGYLSSLEIVEISNVIEREAGITLYPPMLFEHIDVSSLASYFAREFGADFAAVFGDDLEALAAVPGGATAVHTAGADVGEAALTATRPGRASAGDDPIAIIGAAGALPGSRNLVEFWTHLEAGDDLITDIPKERFDWEAYWGDPLSEANKMSTRWGGFTADIDKFDARHFRISPKEARQMDPQQRVFLETVWAALEDSGHRPTSLKGRDVGVFAGVTAFDYGELLRASSPEVGIYAYTSVSQSVLPNRVSYLLGVHGPSEAVDTACSSALVAIHRARQALLHGECELAIAGAVNALLTPELFISFSKAGMLSPDGRCHTFSADANGYVRGEGVGAVVLKPLSAARRDGDHVYAIIRGSAVNHGGRASSFTSPNPTAQARLLVAAYQDADVPPDSVSYIEAHGTGTPLGDPIEVNGLKQAFAALYEQADLPLPSEPTCALGSVKTNIGHLEGAAGIAGLFKILGAMAHETIPRSLHCDAVNPYLELEGSPFHLVNDNQAWKRPSSPDGGTYPRRAGVSSFGVGGTNAHLVLEQLEQAPTDSADASSGAPQLLLLSARDEDRLREYAGRLADSLTAEAASLRLIDVAHSLQQGRDPMPERLALVATDLKGAASSLRQYADEGNAPEGLNLGRVDPKKPATEPVSAEAVEASSTDGDLPALASHWIHGADPDWIRLPDQDRARRVSLPTYPFARTRHWLKSR